MLMARNADICTKSGDRARRQILHKLVSVYDVPPRVQNCWPRHAVALAKAGDRPLGKVFHWLEASLNVSVAQSSDYDGSERAS